MKKWRCSVLLTTALAVSGSCLHAEDVTLYPHPDWTSAAIATIALDDARFLRRGTVVDPVAAALGWQWGEFEGDFTGYVPDAKIGKDMLPVSGAMIHAHPDIDSHVLGSVTDEDLAAGMIEVVDRGEWWTVAFSKSIPVFYREPVVRAEAEDDDAGQVVAMDEPVEPTAPVAPAPVIEEEPESQRTSVSSVGGSLGTTFRGTLRRTKARFMFLSPPYPYELIDANGKRTAYVDLGKAVLRQPASSYLGRNVSIYGPWETIDDSRAIVIRARNVNELPGR